MNRPLVQATRENLRTGGKLQQYGTEHPEERRVTKGRGIFGIGGSETKSIKQFRELEHLPVNTGVVAPTVTGFLAASHPAEAVNLATGFFPGLYHQAKAAVNAVKGEPQELKEQAKGLVHEVTHPFEHPLSTWLMAKGGASAVDYAAGKVAKQSLADESAKANMRSREPREIIPGGATEPRHPYYPGFIRPRIEKFITKRQDERGMSHKERGSRISKWIDNAESVALRITRQNRDQAFHNFHKLVGRLRPDPGHNAVIFHGYGMLADPAARDAEGNSFHNAQLENIRTHYQTPRPGEGQADRYARELVGKHAADLQNNPRYKDNPQRGYRMAQTIAQWKRNLEPTLIKLGIYTREELENAKRKIAFQWHYKDENPYVQPVTTPGESPFRIGGPEGRHVSIEEIDERLRQNGIDPEQLSFTSTRPFQSASSGLAAGRGAPRSNYSKGILTGVNAVRGAFDPTIQSSIRQFVADVNKIARVRIHAHLATGLAWAKSDLAARMRNAMNEKGLSEIERLRTEQLITQHLENGQRHFDNYDNAQRIAAEHYALTGNELVPFRVTHPYAGARDRMTQGRMETELDHSDPNSYSESHRQPVPDEQKRWGASEEHYWSPVKPPSTSEEKAGPWALTHPDAVGRLRKYENDLGQVHGLRLPMQYWRQIAVAQSLRHPIGVTTEQLQRMAIAGAGVMSGLRYSRYNKLIRDAAAKSGDEATKHALSMYEAELHSGNRAAMTRLYEVKTVPRHWKGTWEGKLIESWKSGERIPIGGHILAGVRHVFSGYQKVNKALLGAVARTVEAGPYKPYMGKHLATEFKRVTGKYPKVMGAVSQVERDFFDGWINPKNVELAGKQLKEWAGDWANVSPEMKRAQAIIPFAQWYRNGLRLIFHTLPVHHPIKVGLVAAMEAATREETRAEGQGYSSTFKLSPGQLEARQQGSVPNFLESVSPGPRYGAQYYSAQGSLAAGPEDTLFDAILPPVTDLAKIHLGINPATNNPYRRGEGEEHGLKMAQVLLDNALPITRYIEQLSGKPLIRGKGRSKTAQEVFRLLRTEPEYKVKGIVGATGGGGTKGPGESYNPSGGSSTSGPGEGYGKKEAVGAGGPGSKY